MPEGDALDCGVASDVGEVHIKRPWVPDNGIRSGPLPGVRSSGVPATDRDARVRAGLLGLGLGSKL